MTMWILLYIAALLICGYAVAAPLIDRRHPDRLSFILGMTAALGCGILPLLLLWASLLGMRPGRVSILTITAVALVCVAILKWRNLTPRADKPVIPRMPKSQIAILVLCGFLILFQFMCILVLSAGVPVMEVDAWNIWGLKAKVLLAEPLSPRPEYFTDLSLSYTHLDYPLLAPMLWAGAYAMLGTVDDALGKAWLVLPMAGIVLLLYGALREVVDRGKAILLVALAIGSPAVTRWGGQGLADTTLTIFLLGAAVCMARWVREPRTADAVLVGLFAGLAVWTKLEGSILLASSILVMIVSAAINRRRIRDAIAFLIVAILIALPWWLWSRGLPHTHEDYASRLSLPAISQGLARLPQIASLVWMQLNGVSWSVPAGVFLLAVVIHWRAFRHREVKAIWIILLIQLGAYLMAYLVTPWKLAEIIPVTAARLAMQVSPLAMYLAGLHWSRRSAST